MIAKVLVELSNKNIDKTFDYIIPKDLEKDIKIGIRVKIPFGTMELEGFVLDISSNKETDLELKEIISIVDQDIILNKELLELGKYMHDNLLCTLISCYQAMLPKALKASNKTNINKKENTYLILGDIGDIKLNDKQEEIINLIKERSFINIS